MAALQTATSVVDFLKQKGFKPQAGEKFPLFDQRSQLFTNLGLDKQLGGFRGSAGQNTALLNSLIRAERSAGVSLTPGNLGSIIKIAQGGQMLPQQQVASLQQLPSSQQQAPGGTLLQPIPGSTLSPEFAVAEAAQQQLVRKGAQPPGQPQSFLGAPQAGVIEGEQPAPIQQQQQEQEIPQDIMDRIGAITKTPTAEELAAQASERFFGSPTFPQEQEAIQAEKEQVKLQAQRETENFISQIASRGLFFSGKKQTGVSTIEADKLSELLGIDRKFAMFITQGLQTSAQQVAKEAQAGSKQALEALEKLGFTINPITNRIEPTLEARRMQQQQEQQRLQAEQFQQQEVRREAQQTQQAQQFQQSQERLERNAQMQQERFEATNALAEARLGVQMAQTDAQLKIAERRLQLAEQTFRRSSVAGGGGSAGISTTTSGGRKVSEGQIIEKNTGNPAKVTDSFAISIADARTMLNNDIPAIRNLVDQVDTGPIRANIIKGSAAIGASTSNENQLMALIADLNSKLLNLRSGAAVTPEEFNRLQPLLPSLKNQPERNRDNLIIFARNLEASIKNKLDVKGLEVSGGVRKSKPNLNSFIK